MTSPLEGAAEVDAIAGELVSGTSAQRCAPVAQIVERAEVRGGEADIFLQAPFGIIKGPLKAVRHRNDMLIVHS